MRSYECPFTVQARNEKNRSIISHHHPPLTNPPKDPLNAIAIEIPLNGSVRLPFRADATRPGELASTSWHRHGELNVLLRWTEPLIFK